MLSRPLALCLLALVLAGPALAAPARIQLTEASGQVRLAIQAGRRVKHHLRTVRSPGAMLLLEVSPVRLRQGQQFSVQRGLIESISVSQSGPESIQVRVKVLNLPRYQVLSSSQGLTLVLSPTEMAPQASSPRTVAPSGRAVATTPPRPSAATTPAAPAPSQPVAVAPPTGAPPAAQPAAASPPTGTPPSTPSGAPAPQGGATPSPPSSRPVALTPQAGAAPSPSPAQPAAYTTRTYSLSVEKADLAGTLRGLAREMGLKPVIDPSVQGVVSVNFTGVDADTALRTVLAGTPYRYEIADGALVVGRGSVSSVSPAPAPAPPALGTALARDYFPVQNRPAREVMEALRTVIPEVSYEVDERLNIIMVAGSPADLERVRKILDQISAK